MSPTMLFLILRLGWLIEIFQIVEKKLPLNHQAEKQSTLNRSSSTHSLTK